jgi:hypothetical protein
MQAIPPPKSSPKISPQLIIEVIDFDSSGNNAKIIRNKISQLTNMIITELRADLQMPWLGIVFVSISDPLNPRINPIISAKINPKISPKIIIFWSSCGFVSDSISVIGAGQLRPHHTTPIGDKIILHLSP